MISLVVVLGLFICDLLPTSFDFVCFADVLLVLVDFGVGFALVC